MLTDQEMQEIAEKYISFLMRGSNKELIVYPNPIQKPYGNIYRYDTKKLAVTGDFRYSIMHGPILVEKATGRIVTFGTAYPEEYYYKAYENGTLEPCLTRYWYHEIEYFNYK
jgi:hypothetical protein